MKYNILTETAFFRAAQNGSLDEMTACYGEFIERVVDVCGCKNGKTTAVATGKEGFGIGLSTAKMLIYLLFIVILF